MASETPGTSLPPPPPGGGSGIRYALLGLLLFAVAGALFFVMQMGEEEPETPVAETEPDAGVETVERSTALVETELEIPELEPDAGEPDAGEEETTARTTSRRPATRDWNSCSGSIEASQVRRALVGVNTQIRSCYERELKQNPILQGNITLEVRIGRDGSVAGSQISGSLRDRQVYSCIRGVVSRLRFPAPGGNNCAVVRAPYSFTPRR